MKKTLGIIMALASFPIMCLGGSYEVLFKVAGVAMLLGGVLLADLLDKDDDSQVRIAHDDGDFKMPEE